MTVFFVAILVLARAAPAMADDDTLARIKRDGVMHVSNSGVYPPFEWVENSKLVGFDVDLSNLIAAELGVKADIQVVDFKGLIPALKSGKTDMLITALTYTQERAKQVAFSKPYYPTAMAVTVRKSEKGFDSKDALRGNKLGAEMGTTGDSEARAVPDADTKTYDSLMLAMKDLENGRLDAVISTLPPAQYLIHRNFDDLRISYRYNEGYVAIAMRPENRRLIAAIDQALDHLKSSGKMRDLEMKWFGEASE
jgi:ABC-type amino acid transport substrate-binding protein